jgi:hypothetical protein
MKKWILIAMVAALAGYGAIAYADSSASELPPNWHVHDGQTTLGPQHKPVSFFPAILGQSLADYLSDPARCPNATDKAFLPSAGESESPVLRAGVCMTSTTIIQLRTVPLGTSRPGGWNSRLGPEAGYVTYYLLTQR